MPRAAGSRIGRRDPARTLALALVTAVLTVAVRADDRAGLELFERSIRPYLVERCYGCHATHGTREHDLALDWAGGMRAGGWTGPGIVPGRPDESLVLAALKHEQDLPMPKGGPRPAAEVVAAFTRWIELGAPDPRAKPPDAATLARETSWEETFRRRLSWWSLQPVERPAVPRPVATNDATAAHPLLTSAHPVDRFIATRLAAEGIEPAAEADRETLLRRATLVLTGLPPTLEQRQAFLADTGAGAWERLVDRLLDTPAYAERWARHWLDCVRYCETHGSEGDPAIPHAWRFRDWVIRAFRDDLPIDRFLQEQIAGDLLDDPRIDPATGINESALGIGHLRMVPHGFNPTDPLDEMVTFTDNQIDVFSKAFLGLTVSCARCHDHKFDAISQADFHALYGVFASCRPAVIHVDRPGRHAAARAELAALKPRLRAALADAWAAAVDALPKALATLPDDPALQVAGHPLATLVRLAGLEGEPRQKAWEMLRREAAAETAAPADEAPGLPPLDDWLRYGAGIDGASSPGAFRVEPEGDRVIARLLPAGIHSNLLAANDGAVLHAPRFPIDMAKVRLVVAGEGKARVRVVVWHYPRALGLNYQRESLDGGGFRVVSLATEYFRGDQAHVEIATARDLPVEAVDTPRSYFSIIAAAADDRLLPDAEPAAPLLGLLPPDDPLRAATTAPDPAAVRAAYARATRAAVTAWRHDAATDAQVRLLDALCQAGSLPTRLTELATAADVASLVERYRDIDRSIPPPTRAPGVVEGTVVNQPLFARGDHRRPTEPVPRRFLEALDPRPFGPADSGRRVLADRLVAPSNPLTPRVFVNRVWHHVFGRGLVASVDNLGQMGDLPTHPELLDFLAAEFTTPSGEGGSPTRPWSLKALVRLLAISRTFRLATRPTASAAARDPANLLLAHARLRRLEAEAIRDTLLACAGRLDPTPFGPPQRGTSHRRSIYVAVRRNALDPFLASFDPPSTTSTQGRRDTSHVPAQALVFFNDPWVRGLAEHAAATMVRRPAPSLTARVREAFIAWLGREPTPPEMAATGAWIEELAAAHGVDPAVAADHPGVVADLLNGLLQTEEFIHVP